MTEHTRRQNTMLLVSSCLAALVLGGVAFLLALYLVNNFIGKLS